MSLWKRGNVWWAYFYIDGVRHQRSTQTANRRHAERIAQKLTEEAALLKYQLPHADPDMTFGALAARFLANADPTAHHLDRLKQLLPYFADLPLRRITKPVVRDYRHQRHQRKRVTDTTINRDVGVLRHLLYWAVDEGFIEANPLGRIKLVPERRAPKPVLTVAEERQLLAAAHPHLRDLIVAALDTGMRRGELLYQRFEHVDFARNVLLVTRSKTVQGEGREIPLTARVRQMLDARREPQGIVFGYRGARVDDVKTAWRSTLRRAGVRHLRFHDLRHTFNTRLLEAGVLQEVRKALMGHVSATGVHGRYTHIELPLMRAAITALERWWTEQSLELDRTSQPQEESHDRASQDADTQVISTEALEETDARRSRAGGGGETQGGHRADGDGPDDQEASAPEVRRSQKDL
jgi:integrase